MGTTTRYLKKLLFVALYLITSISYADIAIPNVLGLTLNDATKTLQDSGLSLGSIQNQRTNRPVGTVIVQAPVANKRVSEGYPVRLVIAIPLVKPKTTKVPNLKGMSLQEAKAAIRNANLTLGKIKKRKIKMDTKEVLYQSPRAGKGIVIKSKVDLTLSDPIEISGPRVKVLVGKTRFKSGESTLIQAKVSNVDSTKNAEYGFSINGRTHYTKSSSYRYTFPKAGRYIITASFRYTRGQWHASLSKTVRVSAEKIKSTDEEKASKDGEKTDADNTNKKTKVPNVVGLSLSAATREIKRANLQVGMITKKQDKSGKERVIKQSPRANKRVKKGSKVNLTRSIPEPTPWQKPRAVISPTSVKVTQGEKARFYSKSTYDKATQLSSTWTSKAKQKAKGKKFKISTNDLKAGRYWVKLSIKDDRGFTDTTSAELIVINSKASVEKDHNLTEKETEEATLTTTEKQDNSDAVAAQETTTSNQKESDYALYIEELSKEASNTTGNAKPSPSSGTAMQQQSIPSTIKGDKVNNQSSTESLANVVPIVSNNANTAKLPSASQKIIEEQAEGIGEAKKFGLSWYIWAWLLSVLFIFGALMLIIWGYRQKRYAKAIPTIDYKLKSDDGEQKILLPSKSPLNSIHFNSQVDKGEQQVSLDKTKAHERIKSDDDS